MALSRRDFLRAAISLGGAGVVVALAQACGAAPTPTPTEELVPGPAETPAGAQAATASATAARTFTPSPTPTATPAPSPAVTPAAATAEEAGMTRVALITTDSREAGVTKAIDLLGINPVQGKRVVLKPNFNTSDDAPGSTHNDTLRTLVLKLKEMGAAGIVVAERSGPPDTDGVMRQKGIPALAEELGFELINMQELGEDAWVLEQPAGSHWSNGFLFSKTYKNAECIVQTCNLKTHAYGGHFTMSLKNSVGLVPRRGYSYMSELHSSPNQRKMIAEINTAYNPDLVIMDGLLAFVTGGPDRGTLAQPNVFLSSTDRVAIDAVGVSILRMLGTTPEVSNGRVFEQEQIARAAELGVGVSGPEKIEIVTTDPAAEEMAKTLREILLA